MLQKLLFSTIAQKMLPIFDYFCNKICCPELSKIAQSGRTAGDPLRLLPTKVKICYLLCDGCTDGVQALIILVCPAKSVTEPSGHRIRGTSHERKTEHIRLGLKCFLGFDLLLRSVFAIYGQKTSSATGFKPRGALM